MISGADKVKDLRVKRYVRDMVLELSKLSLGNDDVSAATYLLQLWKQMTEEDDGAPMVDDAA